MGHFLQSARGRTIVGLAIGILFVPVMLGITACLETPIGDPEKGWVDPRVTGVWMAARMAGNDFEEGIVWVFEPYDERTWLVTWSLFEGSPAEDDAEPTDERLAPLTPDQVRGVIDALDAEEMTAGDWVAFKAWLTSIGKSRYLVLEPKLLLTSDAGFDPDAWFAFRLVLRDGVMELSLVELPAGVETRGEAESIIAARADDPDLVKPYAIMRRVPQELYDDIARWTAHGDPF